MSRVIPSVIVAVMFAACAVEDRGHTESVESAVGATTPTGTQHFSGMWRVQWNAGAPIITPVAIDVPDGIQIALTKLALRGAASFYAVGCDIQNGIVELKAIHQHGHDYVNRASLGLQAPQGTGSQVAAVDASLQAVLALASPPLSVPVGATVLRGRVISRMIMDNGTVTDQDPALEDALVIASGTLMCNSSSM